MKIAIVDVAAATGGAASVLKDCCMRLGNEKFCKYEWIVLTSQIEIEECRNVKCVQFPKVKKSWVHRMIWEYFVAPKWIEDSNVDIIFSLQNKAIPITRVPQVVYFHNLFLLNKSFFKISGEGNFIHNLIFFLFARKLTLKSLKNKKCVIVQTEFIKKILKKYDSNLKIKVIKPSITADTLTGLENEHFDEKYKGWIYPARPDIYKGHEDIISAIKYLNDIGKEPIDFEILFTFSGNESKYANKLVGMCKDIKQIKFIGQMKRKDVLKKYQEYGLVITSQYESCPIPIIEAKQFNSPIVCLDYEYAREATQNYGRVYMSSKDEPIELANNLLRIRGLKNIGFSGQDVESSWDEVLELVLFYGKTSE